MRSTIGARDQRRRDDRERALEAHEEQVRESCPARSRPTPLRKTRDVSPIQSLPGAERQRVADDRPEHADESERDEAHHHRVQRVLRAHQAAIEERQRRRHQQHQRRRDQHPRRVGLVHTLTSRRRKERKERRAA